MEPHDQGATVASVLMDLDEKRMWVADGNPCTNPYRELDYSARSSAKPSPVLADRPRMTIDAAFGLITCQRAPGDPRSDVELYADALALAEEAERFGFDSVWVSEHHFVDDGYLPSLLPVCAAIAARTRADRDRHGSAAGAAVRARSGSPRTRRWST